MNDVTLLEDTLVPGKRENRSNYQWLIQRLWFAGTSIEAPAVYAVLDGARDARIVPMIKASGLPYKCLYEGDLPDEILRVAPYVVGLKPNAAFTRALLKEGWGNSWGIFVTVPKPAVVETVRRTMRKYLQVQGPAGQKLLFRFYDPRVMRAYLPSCNPFEAKIIFGSATEILCEEEGGHEIKSFRRETGEGVRILRQWVVPKVA